MTLAATGISVAAGLQQSKAAEKTAKTNAKIAQQTAEVNARQIEAEGQYEQERRLDERSLILGKIRRSYGSGRLIMAGTPLLDEVETAKNLTMDKIISAYNTSERAKVTRYGGAAEASIYKNQASDIRSARGWQVGQSIFGGLSALSAIKTPMPAGNNSLFRNQIRAGSYARNFRF